ncbi:MAG: dehydrogenase [Deltaproteobacteria bacterium]|nr:dehydrogenase [Deltaproteobacteria bacterium]
MELILFYIFGGIAIIASLGLVSGKNPVHSALFMVVVFFVVAALFVLLGAEFLAAAQILVYAGAIMVLFLFVIMLLRLQKEELRNTSRHAFFAFQVVMIFRGGFFKGGKGSFTPDAVKGFGGNTEAVAAVLFTDYLFPFELTSAILLMAMVGAVVLTKKELK